VSAYDGSLKSNFKKNNKSDISYKAELNLISWTKEMRFYNEKIKL